MGMRRSEEIRMRGKGVSMGVWFGVLFVRSCLNFLCWGELGGCEVIKECVKVVEVGRRGRECWVGRVACSV